jgi:hypothetical protein
MASVIISILKKKRWSQPSSSSATTKPSTNYFNTFRLGFRDQIISSRESFKSSTAPPTSTKEDEAARVIQKNLRGYSERKHLKQLLRQSSISVDSIFVALETIAQWHIGWTKCLFESFFVTILIITVCFQAFYYLPTAYDVNSAMITRIGSNEFAQTVKTPTDFYAFLNAHIENFYHTDMIDNPYCNDLLDQYCSLANTINESAIIEQSLVRNCTTEFLNGYVDQSNRIIATSFVTQTRKATIPCEASFDKFEGPVSLYSSTNRFCAVDDEEDSIFTSDDCTLNAINQSCVIRDHMDAFRFRPDPDGFFMFAFSSHLVRGLPRQALQCRVSRLKEMEWLDYRTKRVCVVIGLVTKQGVGRMTMVRECYHFMIGGRVERANLVSSASNFTDAAVAVAMTYTLIFIEIARNVISLVFFWKEQNAMRVRNNTRITCWELLREFLNRIVSFIAPVLILTACGVYLGLVYTSQGLTTKLKVSSLNNLVDTVTELDLTVQLWVAYTTIISIALLVVLGRILALLDFHPTSAIVSGTLRRASVGLIHFFFVFTIVVLFYAFVGMLLLGRTRAEFSNFGLAVNTLLFVAIGEVQLTQDLIFYQKFDTDYVAVIQAVYFWSYVLLVTIILMNLLLSIIVGAFVELQDTNSKSIERRSIHSFGRSFGTSLRFWGKDTYIHCQRALSRVRRCGMTPKKSLQPPVSNPAGEDECRTPWEELIDLAQKHHIAQKAESTIKVRNQLQKIFENETSVELIIVWCRTYTIHQRMKRYEYDLQGLDPDSNVLKGQTLYLLRSIAERVNTRGSVNELSTKFKRTAPE